MKASRLQRDFQQILEGDSLAHLTQQPKSPVRSSSQGGQPCVAEMILCRRMTNHKVSEPS